MRSLQTTFLYQREGRRHLRRSARLWPRISCPVEALALSVERDTETLCPRTVRRYRQELDVALNRLLAEDPERAATVLRARGRISAALDRRRKRPAIPRTSSRKVKDATAQECAAVLADLQPRAIAGRGGLDALLPAFLVAAPRLGLRPVEWCGARIVDRWLVVPCAKATNGRSCAAHRPVGLAKYAPDFFDAVSLIVALMPELLHAHGGWERLRDAMAERLARACKRVGIRRLSLYSLRHAALASWKAAGMLPEEIAALAGHKTCPMQARYASGRHGWDVGAELPDPDPDLVAAIDARAAKANDDRDDPASASSPASATPPAGDDMASAPVVHESHEFIAPVASVPMTAAVPASLESRTPDPSLEYELLPQPAANGSRMLDPTLPRIPAEERFERFVLVPRVFRSLRKAVTHRARDGDDMGPRRR